MDTASEDYMGESAVCRIIFTLPPLEKIKRKQDFAQDMKLNWPGWLGGVGRV